MHRLICVLCLLVGCQQSRHDIKVDKIVDARQVDMPKFLVWFVDRLEEGNATVLWVETVPAINGTGSREIEVIARDKCKITGFCFRRRKELFGEHNRLYGPDSIATVKVPALATGESLVFILSITMAKKVDFDNFITLKVKQ